MTMKYDPQEIVKEKGLSPIPQEIEMKEEFESRYKKLFGEDYKRFLEYSFSYSRKAIRVNTLKISVDDLKKRLDAQWQMTPVPWCKEGFFLRFKDEDRFDIGNLVEHQLGYIYVQDPSSMIPPIVLNPKAGEVVLDLCSAPGSKTTQIAAMMENRGVIVANDVSGDRVKPLGLNTQRCGVMNTLIVLRMNKRIEQVFDKVLVDAPCSATGTVRKSLKTLQMWSPSSVKRVCSEQRRVLEEGWNALKPGGTLVYSTCTLEPEENEGMVSDFLQRHNDASIGEIRLDINRSAPIMEWEGKKYDSRVSETLRISPQDNDTEGFFVAKIRKS